MEKKSLETQISELSNKESSLDDEISLQLKALEEKLNVTLKKNKQLEEEKLTFISDV
jgi:hypothetical protein